MSKGILSSDFVDHILGAAVFGIAFSQLCVQLAVFISCQISVLVPPHCSLAAHGLGKPRKSECGEIGIVVQNRRIHTKL